MIEVSGLAKEFGPLVAVDDVSFVVERGEVLGFLGPNGAGKSTTMRMIAGFLTPTRGTARICGFDSIEQSIPAKARLGYLPEGAPAYADMTPRSFLRFVAGVRGYRGNERELRVDRAVETTQIAQVLDQTIDTLSKGYKRRVGLAQALLHDPDVLIMDEPTDGLDPNQKHEVRTLITEMAPEKAIIVSTHILEEVTAVCTRAMVIARGRVVADNTPDELEAMSRYHNAVTIRARADLADPMREALARIDQAQYVEAEPADDGTVELTVFPCGGASIIPAVGTMVRDQGWQVSEMRLRRGQLDEVFRSLTQAVE